MHWMELLRRISSRNRGTDSAKSAYYGLPDDWIGLQHYRLRVRYQATKKIVMALIGAVILLAITNLYLALHQDVELLMLHQSANGVAWVTRGGGSILPSAAQVESLLANYVRLRESYSADSYAYQYRLVNWMSSDSVALRYRRNNVASNESGFLRRFGRDGIRKIHIDDVVILPNSFKEIGGKHAAGESVPYAEVHFSVITMQNVAKAVSITHMTALLSWKFLGLPSSPERRWVNWSGFEVTYYKLTEHSG